MKKIKDFLPAITIIGIIAGVFALGYYTSNVSSKNPTSSTGNVAQSNDTASHHGGATAVTNSEALNSLVGKVMPDIQLADKDGKTYTNADLKGKTTVLFFNEGLMCYPACWNQIAAFGSDTRFNSPEIQAISVVVDSAKDWKTAIAKMPQLAKATTMFDVGANTSKQLGVLTTASSMHKGSLPGHTYILIDKEGIVRYVFDDPNMAIANDMLFSKIGGLN